MWLHINMLVAAGLHERGRVAMAQELQLHSARLCKASGFSEYYDPLTGQGLGGKSFSWTAATYLYWAQL